MVDSIQHIFQGFSFLRVYVIHTMMAIQFSLIEIYFVSFIKTTQFNSAHEIIKADVQKKKIE